MTGNVLDNDVNMNAVPLSVTWGSQPSGFTGNPDGTYSFLPLNIAQFMTSGGVTINHWVGAIPSSLTIIPRVIKPGAEAHGFGYSVKQDYDNGVGSFLAYPDFASNTLNINPVVIVHGPKLVA